LGQNKIQTGENKRQKKKERRESISTHHSSRSHFFVARLKSGPLTEKKIPPNNPTKNDREESRGKIRSNKKGKQYWTSASNRLVRGSRSGEVVAKWQGWHESDERERRREKTTNPPPPAKNQTPWPKLRSTGPRDINIREKTKGESSKEKTP